MMSVSSRSVPAERETLPLARRSIDSTDYMTGWLVLLFGITANQVIGPLGAIGTPALIVAAGGAFAWFAGRSMPSARKLGIQPLRVSLFLYVWYILATIVFAHTRPLSALEQSSSVREAFTLLSLSGAALLVMDETRSFERLVALLRRLVWAGSFLAVTGVLESFVGRRLIIRVPGLRLNQAAGQVGTRSLFNRPYGTALHPIEFSVVLASLLPLAIFFAMHEESGSRRQRWAIGASVVIALAVPLSISRSGILALVGSLAIMAIGWTWRERAQGLLVAAISLPVLWLTIPGLLGTFRGMFTSFDTDPSVLNRLDRVPRIMDLIREYPLFGRGSGTFSVESYFLVDNEFWVSTIETGIVGICLVYGLMALSCVAAITSRHHDFATRESGQLGYAIAAGIVGIAVSLWTFDAFFFHILRGLLFVLIGASGALWRLTREPMVS